MAFRRERFVEEDPIKGIIQLGSTRPTKIDYPFSQSLFRKSDNEIVHQLEDEKNEVLKSAWEDAKRMFISRNNEFRGTFDNDNLAIAAIAYTLEGKRPMYSDFNKSTRDYNSRTSSKYDYSSYLCLLHKAVDNRGEEFPVFKKTLYRGASMKFDTSPGMYICFRSFTSTSLIKKESMKFTMDDPSHSTLFEIWNGFGLSMEPFSAFPYEREVLISPYMLYKVLYVEKNASGLTVITLDCLQQTSHGIYQ